MKYKAIVEKEGLDNEAHVVHITESYISGYLYITC